MKSLIISIVLSSTLSSWNILDSISIPIECQIVEFYKESDAYTIETRGITNFKKIETTGTFLVPATLQPGKFIVNVSRKENNFYKIETSDLWVETIYCFEWAIWQEVVIIIDNYYGYTKGRIIFN
ncbi:MAG TPA: hypothetical protein PKC30_14790 [Saprospiraceae bacterium]|nr:hypothetical protein [Saprospiraceae bacterium]